MPGLTSTRRIPPGAGIEYVLLAEPARHEGGLDEELENRFRRCGNENLAFNIDYSVHRCLGLRSFLPLPASTVTTHYPRTTQAQLAGWQWPVD